MATNKRKDAAALFELLDRSTLKVPKNPNGSLKIPSWWSSKTNPAAARGTSVPVATPVEPEGDPPPGAAPEPQPASHTSHAAPPPPELAAQHAARAEVAADAPEADSHASHPASPEALPAPAPRQPVRPPAGIVAPQTVDPARLTASNRPLAAIPTWALAAGTTAVAVLIIAAIILATRPRTGPSTATADPTLSLANNSGAGAPPAANPATAANQGLPGLTLNPPAPRDSTGNGVVTRTGLSPTPPRAQPDNARPAPGTPTAGPEAAPVASHPGSVLSAASFQRNPNYWYLRFYAAKSDALAKQNAEFLAEHGLTVSVERSGSYYVVVDARGFPDRDAQSEQYRRQVVAISHEHPDFKKRHKGPYDECYFSKGWN